MEFLVLDDVDLIIAHVKNHMYAEEIEEDEDGDEEGPDLGKNCKTTLPALCSPSPAVKYPADEHLQWCDLDLIQDLWGNLGRGTWNHIGWLVSR